MGILVELIDWSKDVFLPFGAIGLFFVAFAESSFFPVPPDLLLIPLALASPELALFYAFIATIGSVSGSLLGYHIGKKGGRPLLIKLAGKNKTAKVENYFSKYGTLAIGIAAFSPIPYKVFTIAAGVFRHDLSKLILISIIGRGARFFAISTIIMLWGTEILSFFDSYFGFVTIFISGIAILAYIIYNKFKK